MEKNLIYLRDFLQVDLFHEIFQSKLPSRKPLCNHIILRNEDFHLINVSDVIILDQYFIILII